MLFRNVCIRCKLDFSDPSGDGLCWDCLSGAVSEWYLKFYKARKIHVEMRVLTRMIETAKTPSELIKLDTGKS